MNTVLTFLKDFPSWLPLSVMTILAALCYLYIEDATKSAAFKEWTGYLLIASCTAFGTGRTRQENKGTTTEGDVVINQSPDELKDITTPEAIGATEVLKEEK